MSPVGLLLEAIASMILELLHAFCGIKQRVNTNVSRNLDLRCTREEVQVWHESKDEQIPEHPGSLTAASLPNPEGGNSPSLTDEWINETQYKHTMEYYSAFFKKRKF